MKPVQHEHVVEVKVPAGLADKAGLVRDHLEENKRPYLFGIGGVVLGFAVARVFSRPSINIEIAVPQN